MENETQYVIQRMLDYIYSVYSNSTQFSPPGTNATNGYFQLSFREERMSNFGSAATILFQNKDVRDLHECYQNFVDVTNKAFTRNDLYCSSGFQTVMLNVNTIANAVKIIGDFVILIGGNEESRKKAEKDLAEDIGKLMASVNEKGVVRSGCHGNGWVSVYIKNSCPAMKDTINNILLINPTDPDIINIKTLFNNFYDQLSTLETGNHNPWLTGDWQIQFTSYFLAFAKALEQLKSTPEDAEFKIRELIPFK
ncbi:hypothetical protein A3860_18630 [Niastella vici]|uniref:Uncharacterized protein n=1 Tax=Niastella vici TaxID=1703345 RepID=A0A1V9G2A1_9BACT|nr:hypothetical protein [Niastella vici]OQP64775.1 hypothetical protein A3860_18630 [Niastella vici]